MEGLVNRRLRFAHATQDSQRVWAPIDGLNANALGFLGGGNQLGVSRKA